MNIRDVHASDSMARYSRLARAAKEAGVFEATCSEEWMVMDIIINREKVVKSHARGAHTVLDALDSMSRALEAAIAAA